MYKNIITFLVLVLFFGAGTAFAQPKIADQPCDTGFWKQMEARAWLEAEREIMQNQNLIFKQDSVLDYTCFDQFNKIAAAQGGEVFVHTHYFGEQIIKRSQNESTNKALTAVVYLPLSAYRIANFPHKFLGERSVALQSSSTGHSPQAPTSATNEQYNCSHMAAVWQAAKCANFIDNDRFKLMDGFYPFETIKGLDGEDVVGYKSQESGGPGVDETRQFPNPCTRGTGTVMTWEKGVETAENRKQDLYQFQTPLGEIFKEVNDKIEPGNCTGKGIKTGVTVITKDGERGADGVCTNPGCTYNSSGTCLDEVEF